MIQIGILEEPRMKNTMNQRGSVLVFITLMIVLLMIMVGMGLDTGHLAYIRSQGQPAVDASALAAASALPTRDATAVEARSKAFNGSNTYLNSKNNAIAGASNITYAQYDPATGSVTTAGVTVANANAVRVALETTNPHTGAAANSSMASPLFLTPLFNVMGISTSNTANVSVSAVAALKAVPGIPVAIEEARCTASNPQRLIQSTSGKSTKVPNDNSGWTTYYIPNASATEVKNLLKSAQNCSGGLPAVDVGYCTQLNNGNFLAATDKDWQALFDANLNPYKCYMLPVIRNNSNWNQCENITQWATFCPDKTTPVVTDGSDKYLLGDISCNNVNPYNQANLNCYVPTLVRDKKSGM
jgi:Flp pilus assembly protein TadG